MKDKTILITGATGFLGSHIMASLLGKGYRIIVAGRKAGKESVKTRIDKILNWFSISLHRTEDSSFRIKYYEADFSVKNLGLSDSDYKEICSETDIVIHAASDTSFTESSRSRVFAANVENLNQILKLAIDSEISFFHYISSAYGAGTDYMENPEIPFRSGCFTNVYEESKAEAEKKVKQQCALNSIPYTLIRPSIIYGDSSTGRALKFNALYYPVKSLMHIRDIYLNNIKNKRGEDASKQGIFVDKKGKLNLPVKLYLSAPGRINLLPVDYFIKSVISVIENPINHGIYNITNPDPVPVETLIGFTEKFLGIKGFEAVYGEDKSEMRNPAEELFDHFVKPYLPYLSDERVFPGRFDGKELPELTYDIFNRCMSYAVSVQWGKKIFS